MVGSEVDPTGSLWYTHRIKKTRCTCVLKLTLPGHYGIKNWDSIVAWFSSEVDPTGSLWYIQRAFSLANDKVLKLTLPGHYGIRLTIDY